MSAALLRIGQRDAAARVAADVKSKPAAAGDPLVTLDRADARFLKDRMSAIRKARRAP
jgi:hypothetical protein